MTEFPSYRIGLQTVNLTDQVNRCELTARDESGNQLGTPIVDTIAPFGSKAWFPPAIVPEDNLSISVTCEEPYATLANVLSPDFSAAGSFVIPRSGSFNVQLPLLNQDNSGYTTWYGVQNTGAGEATVNVRYSDGAAIDPLTVAPLSLRNVFQSEETHS